MYKVLILMKERNFTFILESFPANAWRSFTLPLTRIDTAPKCLKGSQELRDGRQGNRWIIGHDGLLLNAFLFWDTLTSLVLFIAVIFGFPLLMNPSVNIFYFQGRFYWFFFFFMYTRYLSVDFSFYCKVPSPRYSRRFISERFEHCL